MIHLESEIILTEHMKNTYLFFFLMASLSWSHCAQSQTTYQNHQQRTSRLKGLATANSSLANVESIGKSRGQRDIWLLTLGKGDTSEKPALLIVAGLDGSHLAGTETAIKMAERMLAHTSNDSLAHLLDKKTVYIIASANPDAQEQWAAKLRYSRNVNGLEYDNDRDGRMNEDPFEDLDGNGLITMVRVEDPTGTHTVSKGDSRVMVKADPAKGEQGNYILISEGTDNDKDGKFNEDGDGGVNIDRNFTFDYPIFTDDSGDYAASEPETRAVLDFLYNTANIFAVLTFGPNNNLTQAPKFEKSKTTGRIITGPMEKDVAVMAQVSGLYNSIVSQGGKELPQSRGSFSQTAYYHAGRFSFSTPGWWVHKAESEKDTVPKPDEPGSTGPRKKEKKEVDNEDVQFLKWADNENVTDVFVPWQEIQHPDFPGKKAEVGGIAPYAKWNPPVKYLDETAKSHLTFISGLGMQMPELQLVNVRAESLGNGVSRVTAQIVNKGLLPTSPEIGNRIRWVKKVKTELFLGKNQSIVSGRKINLRDALGAGEAEEYSWLVSGSGKLTIEAGCPTTGVVSTEISLQ